MTMDTPFPQVLSKFRAGDEAAATVVFRRFVDRLIGLASSQFDARFRSKEDPEDVVLSVYQSFLRRDGGKPFDLADWDSLWALLATITVRKCLARRDYYFAACRDVAKEIPPTLDASEEALWEAMDRGPTPEQALMLVETLDELFRNFEDADRRIAELSFQGYTRPEISERCQCSERTVGRVVARVRVEFQKIQAARRED